MSAAENVLFLDRKVMESRLVTANKKLEHASLQQTARTMGKLDNEEIVNTVYCKIIELMPSRIFSEGRIADELNLSLRTLQRKLKTVGTSYGELLQSIRQELAQQYMADHSLSIGEVSHLLGFSEPTNFVRAFKRWMDVTPASYRRALNPG